MNGRPIPIGYSLVTWLVLLAAAVIGWISR